jgi:hypothetical protein
MNQRARLSYLGGFIPDGQRFFEQGNSSTIFDNPKERRAATLGPERGAAARVNNTPIAAITFTLALPMAKVADD